MENNRKDDIEPEVESFWISGSPEEVAIVLRDLRLHVIETFKGNNFDEFFSYVKGHRYCSILVPNDSHIFRMWLMWNNYSRLLKDVVAIKIQTWVRMVLKRHWYKNL